MSLNGCITTYIVALGTGKLSRLKQNYCRVLLLCPGQGARLKRKQSIYCRVWDERNFTVRKYIWLLCHNGRFCKAGFIKLYLLATWKTIFIVLNRTYWLINYWILWQTACTAAWQYHIGVVSKFCKLIIKYFVSHIFYSIRNIGRFLLMIFKIITLITKFQKTILVDVIFST